jgi:ABC-type glycerol-3-phosphate transport system substrate-binding protein
MKQSLWAMVLGAGLLGLAHAGTVSMAHADGTCGAKGQPSCPLQGWMETNMDPASQKGDTKALAGLFEKVAKFNPDPKWDAENPSWSGISKAGADASKAGDLAGAKAQCKSCHKAFREKYKTGFRMKPVPK